MLTLLRPNLYLPSVTSLDLRVLRRRGVRGLILDLDNTLVGWRRNEPSAPVLRWLEAVRRAGIRVVVVSNNSQRRVAQFARAAHVPFISKAKKPGVRSFLRAMKMMGTSGPETAVVGDQVFTDVLGGNRLGLLTILVVPVARGEFVGTRAVRRVERLVLRHFQRQGLERPVERQA